MSMWPTQTEGAQTLAVMETTVALAYQDSLGTVVHAYVSAEQYSS